MADRYICIHGHFYQPPRENPWLEAIEIQDSAYPLRINSELGTEEEFEELVRRLKSYGMGLLLDIVCEDRNHFCQGTPGRL